MLVIKTTRENFAAPTQIVNGIVGKNRQTLPILSNVLIRKVGTEVEFITTDMDIQIRTMASIGSDASTVSLTIDAAKLNEILSTLDGDQDVSLEMATADAAFAQIRQGKKTFKINTMPADEFPVQSTSTAENALTVPSKEFKHLLQLTHFAMAQQDLRYYLNGLYLKVADGVLQVVTTDGHRLALATMALPNAANLNFSCIIPRRAVLEVIRLLPDNDEEHIDISVGKTHILFTFSNISLSTKLVEGKFPDYKRVIPEKNFNVFTINREKILRSIKRAAVMTTNKLHGIRWSLKENALCIESTNSDREEVTDELDIQYAGDEIEIGFNLNYIQDVLTNLKCADVKFALGTDASLAMLVTMPDNDTFKYVVMPMRTS